MSVDLDEASHVVSDQFLSVTIDAGSVRSNWDGLDLKSQRVINMGKALAPAMLRIGGYRQDFLLFNTTNIVKNQYVVGPRVGSSVNSTMNASQWDAINEYALATGWDIIFGLNVFLRNPWPGGDWDTTNAEMMMKYTESKGYKVSWELGNGIEYIHNKQNMLSILYFWPISEPDAFPFITNTTVVSAEQLAKDFGTLRGLLVKLKLKPLYVAGPDITNGGDEFLTR